LQVVTDKALQQDENERSRYRYKAALSAVLVRPEMVVFIDESHKDKNAARRRRWWSRRGLTPVRRSTFSGNRATRYTFLAACDINGFILSACDTVRRGNTREEEADPTMGTIDSGRFELWVTNKLVPILGSYQNLEARSVVVLDNASIHHSPEVIQLIQGAGATILYMAPYSPDLNPIELMFGHYKRSLHRIGNSVNWFQAHVRAMEQVTAPIARSFFRHAQIPGCEHFERIDDDTAREPKSLFLFIAGVQLLWQQAENDQRLIESVALGELP
jgi:DDE superfamily endonuclease